MDIPSYKYSRSLYIEYHGVRVAEEGFPTVEVVAEGIKQMKILNRRKHIQNHRSYPWDNLVDFCFTTIQQMKRDYRALQS